MNRRLFLKGLGIGLLATGCAAPAASPTAAPPPQAAPAGQTTAKPEAKTTQPTAKPETKAPAPSKPLQEVTFRLDWRVIGYHAGFWAAVDKGFFAEQGLDVKLAEGQGSASTMQLVGGGTQMFGFLDAGLLAQAVQRGADARMLACMFQKNMFGIISRQDAPIAKPEDFPGKQLAGSVGGAGEVQWPVFAKRAGIDINRVQFVTTDVPGKYAALLARRVDGAFHQVPTDALDYEAQGLQVHRLFYADYGLDRLGHGLVTMQKTIQEKPDVVKAFVAGAVKGWDWAKQNPDEAVTLSKKFFESNLTPETLAKQWRSTFDFHHSSRTTGKPTGWMDQADWENTVNVLVEAEFLQSPVPADKLFTNQFLPS